MKTDQKQNPLITLSYKRSGKWAQVHIYLAKDGDRIFVATSNASGKPLNTLTRNGDRGAAYWRHGNRDKMPDATGVMSDRGAMEWAAMTAMGADSIDTREAIHAAEKKS